MHHRSRLLTTRGHSDKQPPEELVLMMGKIRALEVMRLKCDNPVCHDLDYHNLLFCPPFVSLNVLVNIYHQHQSEAFLFLLKFHALYK